MYVCEGAVIRPLDAMYRGPYCVLEAGHGGGEGATGGCPGGIPRVCARGSGHRTAGRYVPRPIPCAGQGEEEATLGDRCHADLGPCGPPEAARGQDVALVLIIFMLLCFSFVFPQKKKLVEGNVTARYRLLFIVFVLESV